MMSNILKSSLDANHLTTTRNLRQELLVALSRALTSDGRDFSARELWPKLRLVVTVTGGNFEAASCRWDGMDRDGLGWMDLGKCLAICSVRHLFFDNHL